MRLEQEARRQLVGAAVAICTALAAGGRLQRERHLKQRRKGLLRVQQPTTAACPIQRGLSRCRALRQLVVPRRDGRPSSAHVQRRWL